MYKILLIGFILLTYTFQVSAEHTNEAIRDYVNSIKWDINKLKYEGYKSIDVEQEFAKEFLTTQPKDQQKFTKFFTTYAIPHQLRDKALKTLSLSLYSIGLFDDSGLPLFLNNESQTPYNKVPGTDTLFWIDVRKYCWFANNSQQVFRVDWFISYTLTYTYPLIDDIKTNYDKYAYALKRMTGLTPEQSLVNYVLIIYWYSKPVDIEQAAIEIGIPPRKFLPYVQSLNLFSTDGVVARYEWDKIFIETKNKIKPQSQLATHIFVKDKAYAWKSNSHTSLPPDFILVGPAKWPIDCATKDFIGIRLENQDLAWILRNDKNIIFQKKIAF